MLERRCEALSSARLEVFSDQTTASVIRETALARLAVYPEEIDDSFLGHAYALCHCDFGAVMSIVTGRVVDHDLIHFLSQALVPEMPIPGPCMYACMYVYCISEAFQ